MQNGQPNTTNANQDNETKMHVVFVQFNDRLVSEN